MIYVIVYSVFYVLRDCSLFAFVDLYTCLGNTIDFCMSPRDRKKNPEQNERHMKNCNFDVQTYRADQQRSIDTDGAHRHHSNDFFPAEAEAEKKTHFKVNIVFIGSCEIYGILIVWAGFRNKPTNESVSVESFIFRNISKPLCALCAGF